MKANHQSQQFRLEDNLLKYFPEEIERNKGFIKGLETDMATLDAHPHPKDGFAGMVVRGDSLTDKDNAGAAILEAWALPCPCLWRGSDRISFLPSKGK